MIHQHFVAGARRLTPALVIFSLLLTGCGAASSVTETTAPETGAEDIPAARPTPGSAAQVATNDLLDYCFAYPENFALLVDGSHMEVMGPNSEGGPHPAGLVWINAEEAQGRTALDVATLELNEVGGAHPRSTVLLGGEAALVLGRMPGQDLVRKVYIVHGGMLYTLNFTPDQPEDTEAYANMETLFTWVTTTWVWISSGVACPPGN